MSTDLIDQARTGDEQAFGELVGRYRRELQVHCYRILGSALDAEDALQETLLAAWQGLAGFEGRSSTLSLTRVGPPVRAQNGARQPAASRSRITLVTKAAFSPVYRSRSSA